MTHVPFLIAAFSVFVLVLAADAFGSWLRLRYARRDALRRQERQRARAGVAPGSARLLEDDATGRAEPGATGLLESDAPGRAEPGATVELTR